MNIITVSQVNMFIKAWIDENPVFKSIYIVGEISNFVYYRRSGHIYFTLKDENSQIKAVMFSTYASRLKFNLEDGMRVVCRGRISTYEKDGVYQLYVEDVQPDGVGALNLAFEQLKNKLSDEGLFDKNIKKSIPTLPSKIGVITSGNGAAIEDIKNITKRRYPLAKLVICPTLVQGDAAKYDIVDSLKLMSKTDVDVVIIGRGGGSLEDLWPFNTEEVARAVYEFDKPIVSAVGHETDYTICDFVADLRAETPSAAAEKVVPDISNLICELKSFNTSLKISLKNKIEFEMQRLNYIQNDSVLSKYQMFFDKYLNEASECEAKMTKLFEEKLTFKRNELCQSINMLNSYNPLSILARGYNVLLKDDDVVKSAKSLNVNDKYVLKLSDGTAKCVIEEVNYE